MRKLLIGLLVILGSIAVNAETIKSEVELNAQFGDNLQLKFSGEVAKRLYQNLNVEPQTVGHAKCIESGNSLTLVKIGKDYQCNKCVDDSTNEETFYCNMISIDSLNGEVHFH